MQSVLNVFKTKPNETQLPDEESTPLIPSHTEHHTLNPRLISDIILGLSDGLTVPFALSAGLSAIGSPKLVIAGGFAELISGAISMGLGGFLAAQSEAEHYKNEKEREEGEILDCPEEEEEECFQVLAEYGIAREACQPLLDCLKSNPTNWVNFMMRFELDLSPPPSERLYISALTIGASYFLGGLLPLIPYFFASTTMDGLIWSCVFTGVILVVFGIVKSFVVNNQTGRKEGWRKAIKSGIWTFIVGGLAAGGAFIVVRLLDVKE